MNKPGNVKFSFFLTLATFLLLSLACINTRLATPRAALTLTEPVSVKCEIPDLVGIDQQIAQKSLTSLGLSPVKKAEFNSDVPVDAVISTDPPAGTTLQECQGEITLVISMGPRPVVAKTPVPTRVLPTSTPKVVIPTPTTSIADQLDQPMYNTIYLEPFDTPKNGFNPAWQVSYAAGGASKANKGWLELTGDVTALVGDKNWQDYLVTLHAVDGSLYSLDVFFRMQDAQNTLVMSCQDLQSTVGIGSALHCEWFRNNNGQQEKIAGAVPDEVCTGLCDIVVEAKGSDFRFLFNGKEKFKFSTDTNKTGSVGFKVKSTAAALRLYSFDVSEPQHPASPGVLLFRDDFKTGTWVTGSQEDDLATYQQNLVNGKYQWHINAKQSVSIKQCNTTMTLPDVFTLTTHVRAVSGPKDTAYALVFNCKDYSNLYYFKISEAGSYGFYKLKNGQWTTIIDNTKITLTPGEQNSLQVVGGGGQYDLIFNGKLLTQVKDTSFVNGGIGLGVELYNPGDQAAVEFDDIQVSMP